MPLQKYPLIIIEGGDGTGKTTLANELVHRMGAHYCHLTYRFCDRMDQYHTAALELALKRLAYQPVVLDRWWISEQVYARAFRGQTRWPYMGRMLDRVAQKHAATYVLCHSSDKQVYLDSFEKLKGERVEMYDAMDKVYDCYDAWAKLHDSNPNLIRYDRFAFTGLFSKQHFTTAVDNIIEASFDYLACLPDFALNPKDRRFAGNPMARVILVGDRSNRKTRRPVWPFFDNQHCSLWLAKALDAMDVPEHQLGWLNLFNEQGHVQWGLEELGWFCNEKIINRPTLVAMGANAQRGLDSLGIEYRRIAHPQWFNRFSHHDFTPDRVVSLFNELGITGHDTLPLRRQLGLDQGLGNDPS